jgi:hypothetical protein
MIFIKHSSLSLFIPYHCRPIFNFCQYLFHIFLQKPSKPIAHNVPVVYDVFAARIRACAARPGLQKCGGVLAWE